jgi:hypothetical protein
VHSSGSDNPDTGTARVFYAVGIVPDKRGSVGFGLRNSNTAPLSSCDASRRDRNFYRLAYRIGERLFALTEAATLPNN